jgi:hypothetical protein
MSHYGGFGKMLTTRVAERAADHGRFIARVIEVAGQQMRPAKFNSDAVRAKIAAAPLLRPYDQELVERWADVLLGEERGVEALLDRVQAAGLALQRDRAASGENDSLVDQLEEFGAGAGVLAAVFPVIVENIDELIGQRDTIAEVPEDVLYLLQEARHEELERFALQVSEASEVQAREGKHVAVQRVLSEIEPEAHRLYALVGEGLTGRIPAQLQRVLGRLGMSDLTDALDVPESEVALLGELAAKGRRLQKWYPD